MTLTRRLTADAVVNCTKDERKIVSFSLALKDTYKPKGGERGQGDHLLPLLVLDFRKGDPYLRKGTLEEVTGRIYVTPYVGRDGMAKASLNCHVSNIKMLAWPKEVIGQAQQPATTEKGADEVTFRWCSTGRPPSTGAFLAFYSFSNKKCFR